MMQEFLPENKDGKNIEQKDSAFLLEQYRVLANDRVHHDQLFWSVPITFLTAQSFLLVIALGGFETKPWQSAIGAFISFVFGILSIQVFERNRILEISDAEQMLDMEKHFLSKGYKGSELHQKSAKKKYLSGGYLDQYLESKKFYKFLNRGASYELWKKGMWLTTVISLLLFLYNTFLYFQCEIFAYNSFRELIDNIDRNAVSNIFILAASNWFVYLVVRVNPNQQIVTTKINNIFHTCLGLFEGLSILCAIIYSWKVMYDQESRFPQIWFVLNLFYLVVLSVYLVIALRRKPDASKNYDFQVMTLLLAGGKNIRLKSIKNAIVKFHDIKTPEKISLLENSYKRNSSLAIQQTIITVAENVDYVESAFNGKVFKKEELSSAKRTLIEKSEEKKTNHKNNKQSNIKPLLTTKCIAIDAEKQTNIPVWIEPYPRGTATAIFYFLWKNYTNYPNTTAYDPVLIIAPTDHLISEVDLYIQTITKVCKLAKEFNNIYLLGIVPYYVSNQYGYIQVNNVSASVLKVERFIEKPDYLETKSLHDDGFILWNSGIFIARLSVLKDAFRDNWKHYHEFPPIYSDDIDLKQLYNDMQESSFDRDVLEYIDNLYAVRVMFDWIDVGDPVRLQSAIYDEKCSIG